MKVFEINSVPYGSTAKIMLGISKALNQEGIDNMVSSGYSYHPLDMPENHIRIGSALDKALHIFLSRITGFHGTFSYFSTSGWVIFGGSKQYLSFKINLNNLPVLLL